MALTTNQREALILARRKIMSGSQRFICIALLEVADEHPNLKRACSSLRSFITKQLDCPPATLECWQRAHGVDSDSPKEDRIAWIDWLLDGPSQNKN